MWSTTLVNVRNSSNNTFNIKDEANLKWQLKKQRHKQVSFLYEVILMYMNITIKRMKRATKIIVAFILGFLLGIAL